MKSLNVKDGTVSWGRPFYCCLCCESMINYARTLCPIAQSWIFMRMCINVSVHTIVGGIQAGVSLRHSVDGDTSASVMSLLADEGYCGVHSNSYHGLSQLPRKAPTWLEGGVTETPSCPCLFLNLFLFPFHSFLYQNTGDETWYIATLPFTHAFYYKSKQTSKMLLFCLLRAFELQKTYTMKTFSYIWGNALTSVVYDAHLHSLHSQCMCWSVVFLVGAVKSFTEIPHNCDQWALHVTLSALSSQICEWMNMWCSGVWTALLPLEGSPF